MSTLERAGTQPTTPALPNDGHRAHHRRHPAPPPEITVDRIRVRAYEIYLARGQNGEGGDEASDWLRAERELMQKA